MQNETEYNQRLVLASGSPRRAELLRQNGYLFEVDVPGLEEPEHHSRSVSARQHAEALSYFKARAVAEKRTVSPRTASPGSGSRRTGSRRTGSRRSGALRSEREVILAADTVVSLEGGVIGKAADERDARRILSTLTGTTHAVITGVTVLDPATGQRGIRYDETLVTMRSMPEAVLDAYVESGAWKGKAGAYGIQDHGDAFIERIDGSFTNVVGLPMELVSRMLSEFGIEPGRRGSTNGATCPAGT